MEMSIASLTVWFGLGSSALIAIAFFIQVCLLGRSARSFMVTYVAIIAFSFLLIALLFPNRELTESTSEISGKAIEHNKSEDK